MDLKIETPRDWLPFKVEKLVERVCLLPSLATQLHTLTH
jgi:hypothetical protein